MSPELLDEIGRVLTWPAEEHQIREAMRLVPDDVVQLITASGTPDECRRKVQEYIDAGCTCPVLYPLGDDVKAMIDAFQLTECSREINSIAFCNWVQVVIPV